GLVYNVLNEFKADFDKATVVTLEYINEYDKLFQEQFLLNRKIKEQTVDLFEAVVPNIMQQEALSNLAALRLVRKNKALIISATGTGKTFLSAFDAKNFNPQKLLFVVHRQTIDKYALNSFKKIFGNTRTIGIYSGNKKEVESDFIFSTVQTISKPNYFNQFSEDHFDYIIIDESHRSSADSYNRILNYFKPRFLLGMTATPERTDGNNIFEQFDYNIGYEIRLNRAMEEEMLSSFHYYGVT